MNAVAIKNVEKNTFSVDTVEFVSTTENKSALEISKLVKMTSMSINTSANAQFKTRCYLTPHDVETIKDALNNFTSKDVTVNNFKAQLISDLTDFQDKIVTNHIATLRKLRSEKALLEKSARDLDAAKNKIVMDRLSKIQWPYNEVTKQIDSKIAVINVKTAKYAKRIQELEETKPVAEEKDLILYQMEMKQKYNVK